APGEMRLVIEPFPDDTRHPAIISTVAIPFVGTVEPEPSQRLRSIAATWIGPLRSMAPYLLRTTASAILLAMPGRHCQALSLKNSKLSEAISAGCPFCNLPRPFAPAAP